MADENGFAEWGGYMEAKITKLEEQFSAASAPFRKSNLFAGISIYVNGLTNPSADELKRIMMIHGGVFHHYERSHTTYIIASNLPDVKVRNMDTSKIISAKWIVDCIAENRILDYTKYLLYTNQKTTQPRLSFTKAKKEEPPDKLTSAEEVAKLMEDLADLNAKMREGVPKEENNEIQTEKKAKQTEPQPQPTTNIKPTSIARTAVDPNFLPEFYNNSRLHHIATLGAGFKQYITELREKNPENEFPARQKLREKLIKDGVKIIDIKDIKFGANKSSSIFIMHIDMDCFFVSVGLRNHPHLRGKPVAVTHSKGGASAADVPVHPKADREAESALFAKRFEQHLHNNILSDKVQNGFGAKLSLSEIASCSYEARAKGIRNGMFVGHAIKLCPELKTIPYDFEGYKEVAYTLYDIIAQYTLKIEAVSCDEMFVDLSDIILELQISPMDFVTAIRNEVREKTGCPCSAGVGANKLQARMATRHAKPDGQYHLNLENVMEYMSDIPVKDLPGVGSNTSYILKQAGFTTCGDLQNISLLKLQNLVGKKFGETLYQFCRGLDDRTLNYEQIRKSVSAEVNYGIRFKEYTEVENFLRQLCNEVHSRLSQIKRKTKCITLKVMVRAADAPVETSKFMGHGVCEYITKSESLVNFTNDLDVITRIILKIMKNLNLPPNELRGIGIQLTKLDQLKELPSRETKENSIKNMFAKLKEKQTEVSEQSNEKTVEDSKQIEFKEDPPHLIDVPFSDALKPTARKRTTTVLSMLQEAHTKKQKLISNNNNNNNNEEQCVVSSTNEHYEHEEPIPLPPNIDPEVFAALPPDIRQEILNDIGPQMITTTTTIHNEEVEPVEIIPPLIILSSSPVIDENQLSEKPTVGAPVPALKVTTNSLPIDEDSELDLEPSTSRAAEERRERKRLQKTQVQTQNLTDFLQALPLDLRSEIEADMAAQIPQTTTTIKENYEEPAPIASISRTKTDTTAAATTGPSSLSPEENIFMQPNCKELLLEWLNSNETPNDYDVDLCCQHARAMARSSNQYLTILYGSIAYFRKLIDKKQSSSLDNAWSKACCDIINCIVDEVNAHFPGRNLLTRDMHLNMPN